MWINIPKSLEIYFYRVIRTLFPNKLHIHIMYNLNN